MQTHWIAFEEECKLEEQEEEEKCKLTELHLKKNVNLLNCIC